MCLEVGLDERVEAVGSCLVHAVGSLVEDWTRDWGMLGIESELKDLDYVRNSIENESIL